MTECESHDMQDIRRQAGNGTKINNDQGRNWGSEHHRDASGCLGSPYVRCERSAAIFQKGHQDPSSSLRESETEIWPALWQSGRSGVLRSRAIWPIRHGVCILRNLIQTVHVADVYRLH